MDSPKDDDVLFGWGWVHPYVRRVFLTTPPYPARETESLSSAPMFIGAGTYSLVFVEAMAVSGDVNSFALTQVFFPVEYQYIGAGQSPSDYHENLAVSGDVIGFQLGQMYFPRDYSYLQSGQSSSNYHEDLALYGDITSFDISSNGYTPIDYTNWPPESLAISGDVASFILGPP